MDDTAAETRRTGRRAATFVIGAATLLAATLLAARTGDQARNALPAGHFRERIVSCLPARESESNYAEADVASCLQTTLLAAEELGNLQTARLDLGELVRERPWLHNYCHLAEHRVGEELMTDPDDVPGLLLDLPGNTCSWGIGHGLLETFGAAKPDENAWEAVTDTCRSLRERGPAHQEVYSLCADGLGHAAWDHHRELPGAAARCRALTEPSAVSACATGIIMQRYRPAETGKQPVLDPGELDAFCQRTWPDRDRASLEGCATGAGYVLSLSLVGDDASAALAVENDPESQLAAAADAARRLGTAADVCRTLDDLAATCLASLVTNLPLHLFTDAKARILLCEHVEAPLRNACTGT